MAQLFASKFWVSYPHLRFPIAALKSDLNVPAKQKHGGHFHCRTESHTQAPAFLSLLAGVGEEGGERGILPCLQVNSESELGVPASVGPGHPLAFSGP